MHEAALAQAALPARSIILGTLLRPYSLGHELFLLREQSPLVLGGSYPDGARDVGYEHLEQAVIICCQRWEEYTATDFWAGLKFQLWKWRTWHWKHRVQIKGEIEAFQQYRDAGSLEFPPSEIHVAGRTFGRMPGAPFLLRVHQFLTIQMRLSQAEAWDYPYGLAKMQWHAFYESEGGCEIENAHEAFLKRYRDEEDAKEAAAKSEEVVCQA